MSKGYLNKEEYEKYIKRVKDKTVSPTDIDNMKSNLQPLVETQFDILSIPKDVLKAFEPSQIGTIVGTLMDACIPYLSILTNSDKFESLGLQKNQGNIGDREMYPDYIHTSKKRLELKLIFVDNPNIEMKKPPTPRESSARLTQKVTFKNVKPEDDMLLVIAYTLKERFDKPGFFSPTIIDFDIFPVSNCILERDRRMYNTNGGWFGNFETPTILSKQGKKNIKLQRELDYASYGRKKDEHKDFNEDTNFGKLKRIPYKPLQDFIKPERYNNFFDI